MRIELHEQDGFKSIRTTELIAAGDLVLDLSDGDVQPTPTRTSIRVGAQLHAEHAVGRFINHSCKPSCVVKGDRILALWDLPAGTEVTFDYSDNEGPLASPFACINCGEMMTGSPPPCRKLVAPSPEGE
jgi:hypothetical protein